MELDVGYLQLLEERALGFDAVAGCAFSCLFSCMHSCDKSCDITGCGRTFA